MIGEVVAELPPDGECWSAGCDLAVGPLQRADGVVQGVDMAKLNDRVSGVVPGWGVEAAAGGAEQADRVDRVSVGGTLAQSSRSVTRSHSQWFVKDHQSEVLTLPRCNWHCS